MIEEPKLLDAADLAAMDATSLGEVDHPKVRLRPLKGFLLTEAERMLGFDVEQEAIDYVGDATDMIKDRG